MPGRAEQVDRHARARRRLAEQGKHVRAVDVGAKGLAQHPAADVDPDPVRQHPIRSQQGRPVIGIAPRDVEAVRIDEGHQARRRRPSRLEHPVDGLGHGRVHHRNAEEIEDWRRLATDTAASQRR